MAYGDYGGYAHKNWQRVAERSDAVLSPEGIKSTPGAWPGWTIPEGRTGGSYHVLLGDGPIFVGLYKQTSYSIHRLGEELNPRDHVENPDELEMDAEGWFDTDPFVESGKPLVLNVDGCRIRIFWTREDNFYIYAHMEQPDGSFWSGWSGYGVGAGFDEEGADDRQKKFSDLLYAADNPEED